MLPCSMLITHPSARQSSCGKCLWRLPLEIDPLAARRRVRLFRNGRNQAVRIPVEFELPGGEAMMHRDGDRLVIEPLRKLGLIVLLKTMQPLDEELPEIENPAPLPKWPP